MKAFLSPESGMTRDAVSDAVRHENKAEDLRRLKNRLKSKRQEFKRVRKEGAEKEPAERSEHKRRKKRAQQEVFQLEREVQAAEKGVVGEPQTGALPDFVVIGAMKCGTTFLYHLLTQHPYVEPAASKELHFFDSHFDLGTEWYRRCFPTPTWMDGHRSITGEATPYYMFHPHTARRMAEVVPQARLITLLRNPVDRAYSHYNQLIRKGGETLSFEEATHAEEARLRGERDKMLEDERYGSFEHQRFSYLSRGLYVDQLLRWSEFFPKEQMLVLKSEDFFEHPADTLKLVEDFLELPEWEPEASGIIPKKRNRGDYEQKMDPATRRRLGEFFEPHNRRLYEHLGVDLGW